MTGKATDRQNTVLSVLPFMEGLFPENHFRRDKVYVKES